MELKIQNWGNSAAVRLSQVLLKQINVKVGESLDVEVQEGRLILKPSEPVYTMEELLDGCTEENMRPTNEDKQWLNAEPVGREFK